MRWIVLEKYARNCSPWRHLNRDIEGKKPFFTATPERLARFSSNFVRWCRFRWRSCVWNSNLMQWIVLEKNARNCYRRWAPCYRSTARKLTAVDSLPGNSPRSPRVDQSASWQQTAVPVHEGATGEQIPCEKTCRFSVLSPQTRGGRPTSRKLTAVDSLPANSPRSPRVDQSAKLTADSRTCTRGNYRRANTLRENLSFLCALSSTRGGRRPPK